MATILTRTLLYVTDVNCLSCEKPKIHYRLYTKPPMVPNVSQLKCVRVAVHAPVLRYYAELRSYWQIPMLWASTPPGTWGPKQNFNPQTGWH